MPRLNTGLGLDVIEWLEIPVPTYTKSDSNMEFAQTAAARWKLWSLLVRRFFDGYQNHLAEIVWHKIIVKRRNSAYVSHNVSDCIFCENAAVYRKGLRSDQFDKF